MACLYKIHTKTNIKLQLLRSGPTYLIDCIFCEVINGSERKSELAMIL